MTSLLKNKIVLLRCFIICTASHLHKRNWSLLILHFYTWFEHWTLICKVQCYISGFISQSVKIFLRCLLLFFPNYHTKSARVFMRIFTLSSDDIRFFSLTLRCISLVLIMKLFETSKQHSTGWFPKSVHRHLFVSTFLC